MATVGSKRRLSLRIPATAEGQQALQDSKKTDSSRIPPDWYEARDRKFIKYLVQHRAQCVKEERVRKNGEPDEMTNATKEAIIEAKFDFATLSGCISDIRKGFWNIERTNEFYKNKLKQTHSHFYQ